MVHGWLVSDSQINIYICIYIHTCVCVCLYKALKLGFVITFCCFRLFFAVFHVTDQNGNKLFEDNIAEQIQQVDLQNQILFYILFMSILKCIRNNYLRAGGINVIVGILNGVYIDELLGRTW